MGASLKDTEKRVRAVLEEELAKVETKGQAEAVVRRVELVSAGTTEADHAIAAEHDPAPAAVSVEKAATNGSTMRQVADTLVEATGQAVASTPEAPAVSAGAHDVMGAAATPKPRAERGLRLLRTAALRRMQPLDRLDVRVFLAINGFMGGQS